MLWVIAFIIAMLIVSVICALTWWTLMRTEDSYNNRDSGTRASRERY